MKNQMTSEERLLKLIRKKKPAGTTDAKANSDESSGLKKQSQGTKDLSFSFVKSINRLLIVVCAGIMAYIGFVYVGGRTLSEEVIFANKTERTEKIAQMQDKGERKSFDYYESMLSENNIFLAPWERETGVAIEGSRQTDLGKNLNLVGIILDEQPTAIIEDLKSKQTLFMNIGDKVNGAELNAVLEDRAVFLYNGQTIELVQ